MLGMSNPSACRKPGPMGLVYRIGGQDSRIKGNGDVADSLLSKVWKESSEKSHMGGSGGFILLALDPHQQEPAIPKVPITTMGEAGRSRPARGA